VHWNGSHDIISGNAGIGLLLLEAHRQSGDAAHLDLARRAGDRLIAVGEKGRAGLIWYPSLSMRRNMPNFSHGTAGVAYFLATLYERTREQRFLDAALAGAAYLDAIAVRKDGGTVIHHHDEGGEELFYLSWCHGPAGTARLFHRLHRVTGDGRWREWVTSLGRGMLAAGIPERRTPGFWNNISQCCGNIGVGEYFLAMARLEAARGGKGAGKGMIGRVVDDTLRRATSDDRGLRWVQAEHRVQPENLVAQTGYMQGAAGVGAFLLQLDAFERGAPGRMPLPDDPFRA
jgi:lantibiotic modifying enzyme